MSDLFESLPPHIFNAMYFSPIILTNFVTSGRQHDVTEQGDMNPYDGKDIHQAIAFYDSQTEAHVKQDATEAGARLRGLLGILLVNV